MQINNLTLHYLLEQLKPVVVGGFVNKIQEIRKGLFKIRVHTKSGSKDLIVTDCAIFLTQYSFTAKQNPNSFFSKLKQLLSNKKVLSISQHEFDRVAVIEFSDFFLILEFFHKSNVILTDNKLEILFVLRREEWKDRALKKGEQYKFPSSKGQNPKKISTELLFKTFQKSSGTAIKEIILAVNIAPLIAEEVFLGLGIDKKTRASLLTKGEIKKISKKIEKFYTLKKTALKPVKFKEELLPFALPSLKGQVKVNSLESALDEFYSNELISKPADKILKEKETIQNRLKFSLLEQQKHQKKLESSALENREMGDFIYGHFNELEELLKAVKISQEKKINKKEVMYKINSVLSKKVSAIEKIVEINLIKKEVLIDLKSS